MGIYNRLPVIDRKKECGNCHETKALSEFHRNRNGFVAHCKKCRNEYAKKYRQRPESKKIMRKYVLEYRKNPENRERLNARTRLWRKKPQAKIKRNETRRIWTAKEKQKAIDYKGGKCQVCGYSKCLAALDFHHIDPSKKNGYGTGALKAHWSFDRNKSELNKCVLVCVRCHREIHAGVTLCPAC